MFYLLEFIFTQPISDTCQMPNFKRICSFKINAEFLLVFFY